jgi:DNA replication protein DnaC
MIEQTLQLAKELKLTGVHESAERRCAESNSNGLMPEEFLKLVLSDELVYRQNKIAKKLESKAKFRHQSCLEDWDTTYDRGLSKAKLRELSLLSFLNNREHLLLLGSTGSGKTQLAIGLGRRVCAAGHSVLFISVSFFFEEALASRSSGKYLSWVRNCACKDVLILDDFGLRKYKHDEASILMDVLEERQSKGVLIITSQVNSAGWQSLFEDPVIGEAIVDRMTQPSQTVTLTGSSYRSKSGIKNGEKLVTKTQKS